MKRFALVSLFIVGCMFTYPVASQDKVQIELPADVKAKCAEHGGCILITKENLQHLIEEVARITACQPKKEDDDEDEKPKSHSDKVWNQV